AEDASTGDLAFTIGDAETLASGLTLGKASSDETLLPLSGIAFGGSGANRTVSVTPASGLSGSAIVTVSVSDGVNTGSTEFVVTVTDVNDAPMISSIDAQTIAEDSSTGALAFTIGDAETVASGLTLGKASSDETLLPLSGIVFGGSDANRTVSVTPAAGLSGSATVTVSVSDGVNTVSADFVVTVTDVNDDPTISSIDPQTIAEDGSTGDLAFTVGDEETLASALTLGKSSSDETLIPLSGIVFGGSDANRTVSVTPAASLSGSATVTISVSDGVNTVFTDFVVTVTDVNDVPVAYPDNFEIGEDTPLNGTLSAFDEESYSVQFTLSASASNGNVSINTDGSFDYTPDEHFYGTDSFSFTVSDDENTSLPATVEIDVLSINDQPVLVVPLIDHTVYAEEEFSYVFDELSISDPDVGDVVNWSLSVYPSWLSLDSETLELSGTPAVGDIALHSITVLFSDSNGGDLEVSFTIDVLENGLDTSRTKAGAYSTWWIDASGNATSSGGNIFKNLDPDSNLTSGEFSFESMVGVEKVDASKTHALFLLADGSVIAQGDNQFDQLGGELLAGQTQVSPLPTETIVDVAVGDHFSLAVSDNGELLMWGLNEGGYLFENDDVIETPVSHSGLLGVDLVSAKAGNEFAVALDSSGDLWAWGQNESGQLGRGDLVSSSVTQKINVGEVVVDYDVGHSHMLILGASGTVYGVGSNFYGQLGLASKAVSSPAVIATNIQKIATTNFVSVLLNDQGEVLTSGGNFVELGRAYTENTFSSVPLPAGFPTPQEITAGNHHVIIFDGNGDAVGWGDNGFKQLGETLEAEFLAEPTNLNLSL
ncbi:tandem-95 repeat protein, partial [Puniceicoccaceae bacterium K14]|nr:tandem-95 repeat protein [Puniceicoccaceae bacterium K14]